MARFTADTLQAKYGDKLGQPPLSDAKTPRMLRNALLEMTPPLDVSDGIILNGITHIKSEWDNTHQVRGINAPQGIHRMQCIRWIQHQIVMRGRTCRTVRYPSYAMHNMDATWNCNVRGDLPHRMVSIEYSASDGYGLRHASGRCRTCRTARTGKSTHGPQRALLRRDRRIGATRAWE